MGSKSRGNYPVGICLDSCQCSKCRHQYAVNCLICLKCGKSREEIVFKGLTKCTNITNTDSDSHKQSHVAPTETVVSETDKPVDGVVENG